MGLKIYKESYTGTIREITLGKGKKAVTVGGEACYPFYNFEGDMPNKPVIAMEVWDMEPEEWPEAATSHFLGTDANGEPFFAFSSILDSTDFSSSF